MKEMVLTNPCGSSFENWLGMHTAGCNSAQNAAGHGCCVLCAVSNAGHYELNLALPLHAAIATRLRDVSNDSPDGPTWMNLLYDCAT